MSQLKAGVGRAVISPDQPEKLLPTGMGRLISTRGVLDDTTAEALAIQVGEQTAFVISADLRRLEYDWVVKIRKRIAEEIGCDPKKILFSSIHNHCSSPMANPEVEGTETALEQAIDKTIRGIGDACIAAYNDLRDAEMAAAEAKLTEPVGQVRRMQLGNGTVVQCWGSGPIVAPGMKLLGSAGVDPVNIDMLCFREPGADKPFALLTSYPSHPHLYELPYFSGESAGGIKREVEKRIPGLTMVYTNGTGGNVDMHCIHPMPREEDEAIQWFKDSCQLLGNRFADAVETALPRDGYTSDVTMKHSYWSEFEDETQENSRMVIINSLVLNDVAIVSLPGEMFVEYGYWMHENNPFKHLLLAGYNGSTQGYVATPIGFEQGGYETMRGPAPSKEEEGKPMVSGQPNVKARVETGQEFSEQVISLLTEMK